MAALTKVKAAKLYVAFMDAPLPPNITLQSPELPWHTIWRRVCGPSLPAEEADLAILLVHNILPASTTLA
jgi:hypothetical protein